MSLGERIQQLRKANGLSQEQLADSLNVSRQAISKWETDQSSPEIDKILALSRVFSISTDELLGNDDVRDTGVSKTRFREMTRRFSFIHWVNNLFVHINRKAYFLFFTLLCFIAVGVCIIVDYAINQSITWAAYPIISIPIGWLLFIPFIYRKYAFVLCVLTLATIPLLYFLDRITPAPDWFYGLGIPLALMGIALIWVLYLLYHFIKINVWYKAALTVFLAGVVNVVTDYFVDGFSGTEQPLYITLIEALVCIAISSLIGLTGYMRNRAKSADNAR